MTQADKVLRHLTDYGSITAMEALRDYSIMRLGARIWDLKHRGVPIITEIEHGVNRYDEPTHWARYILMAPIGE